MKTVDPGNGVRREDSPLNSTDDPNRFSAARIAGVYLVAGLLWIGTSDVTLAFAGGLTGHGFLVAVGKGSVFVLLSTGLVYWLCRREYRKIKQAADLLRAVVEGTTDAVFVKDRNGRYLLVNSAAARFSGRTVAEVLGHDDRMFFDAQDSERLMASDREIMAGGVVVTLEETLSSGGVTRTYQSTKAPYLDSQGKVQGLVGISRDVTDRVLVEMTLRDTDKRFREAQRIARLGSWSWEPPTDRVWWSDAEFELFGVDPQSMRPSFEAFLSLLHPDDRAVAIARVESMMAGADTIANDMRIVRPDGALIWIHSRALATRDAAGKIVRVEGTDQDITDQRIARDALLDSERKLQAAVEVAGLGVIVVDYDRQIAELSPRAAEHFGFPDQLQVSRTELHSRFHPEDSDELAGLIESAMDPAGPGCFGIEHRVVRHDGSIRWLSVRKQVTFVENRPQRAVVVSADITERKASQVRMVEQEMLVREAAELALVGGWGFDPVTLESDWTPEVARMYGLDPNAPPMMEMALEFFAPEQRPALEAALAAAAQQGVPHDMELRLIAADGEQRWVRTICRPIVEGGRVVRVRGSLQDITARKQLEDQFRQAQKMEAVGRLAGGVAHDFNNLLTVINVYSELILAGLAPDDPARGPLTEIHDAGDRAARLTEQLLAFSRKSMIEPRLVDLNELVIESAKLIRRLIGEDIGLNVLTDPEPVRVVLDPGQLEQVLMNLAVNARDAMPTGGRLTIETRMVTIGEDGERVATNTVPGRYAVLRVADTGCGMTAEVREKIFEPFFTTKGIGKGTGLGLAVVHGIVQQSGGKITVDSTVGVGTTFQILLPAVKVENREAPMRESAEVTRGTETVLVVEDEDAVRTLVQVALEAQGYRVLSASGGREARELLATNLTSVDLLVTDVIMPELSGPDLAVALRAEHPGLRVLYMSGYTDDALDRFGLHGTKDQFLQKPFSPLSLARKVREVLDHHS